MTLTWLDNLIIVAAHWALADIVCCLLRSIKGMPEVNLFWARLGAGVSLIVCWAISNLDGNIAWIFPGMYALMFLEVYLICKMEI
jgi:hypothetical protein